MDGHYEFAEHTFIVATLQNINRAVPRIYQLPTDAIEALLDIPDPFDGVAYRVSVFLSAYSRRTRSTPLSERPPRNGMFREGVDDGYHTERKENWLDVCVRVVEGTMSFYIEHMRKNMLPLPSDIDRQATDMVMSMARMEWVPPGRGLFAMGTRHTFENGNAALNNCYAVATKDGLVKAASWCMDMLMCGGGVGFSVDWRGEVRTPDKNKNFTFVIPDTRQGWVAALELLLRAYIPVSGVITNAFPLFDYSIIRGYDEPIKGFGGTSSGPAPLKRLLTRVEICLDAFAEYQEGQKTLYTPDVTWKLVVGGGGSRVLEREESFPIEDRKKQLNVCVQTRFLTRMMDADVYAEYPYDREATLKELKDACQKIDKPYNHVRLIMDIFNNIGQCVVAGNVRRSAQIALGDPDDLTFLDMKDWVLNPERRPWMHLSNNSIRLWKNEDFEQVLPLVGKRIRDNGEPGIVNMINIQRYGRFGDVSYGRDEATLLNPCAEICLESFEPCCLASIIPSKCIPNSSSDLNGSSDLNSRVIDYERHGEACRHATFYATVITTVPHHWPETNKVICRNRRIGVSYNGIADVREVLGPIKLVESYRKSYKRIRQENADIAQELGIPPSKRVTTVKPEGTLSIITGTSPGVHYPIVRFGWRRVSFPNFSPVLKALVEANYLTEKSTLSETQTYVIFPIMSNASRTTRDVSIFEKMSLAISAQKHYADNSVSFTGDFSPSKEADKVEDVLAEYIPMTKVISMLPQFEGTTDQFKHVPFEEISEEKYHQTIARQREVDWNMVYSGGNQEDADKSVTAYCTGGVCTRG